MKTSIALLTLGLCARLASTVPTIKLLTTAPACNNYVLISARGTGEPQGHSAGFVHTIGWTLENVPGGVEYDVLYPASTDPKSAAVGVADVIRYIKAGIVSCPSQRYALLGYSQGAVVIQEAMRNMTWTSAEKAVFAMYSIGNPYQKPYSNATVDQSGGGSTRNGTGVLYNANPSLWFNQRWIDAGKVKNVCYTGDAVCMGAYSFTTTSPHAHFQYVFDQNVQKIGSDFLTSMLR